MIFNIRIKLGERSPKENLLCKITCLWLFLLGKENLTRPELRLDQLIGLSHPVTHMRTGSQDGGRTKGGAWVLP